MKRDPQARIEGSQAAHDRQYITETRFRLLASSKKLAMES